jgi:hypothetical protein
MQLAQHTATELLLLAAIISIQMTQGLDSDSVQLLSDFVTAVAANLSLIANDSAATISGL